MAKTFYVLKLKWQGLAFSKFCAIELAISFYWFKRVPPYFNADENSNNVMSTSL